MSTLDDRQQLEVCILCGAERASDGAGAPCGPRCAVCGWRVGDSPDSDLPLARVEVVYYLRWEQRIKIGTSSQPRQRLAAIWHQELLGFERGGRALERQRHVQFADLREGGEWFRADAALFTHIRAVTAGAPPWHSYARWMAEALRASTS